jgi:hypothetical protein
MDRVNTDNERVTIVARDTAVVRKTRPLNANSHAVRKVVTHLLQDGLLRRAVRDGSLAAGWRESV